MGFWDQVRVYQVKLDQIITRLNFIFGKFPCELGPIMAIYNFL